MKKRILYLFFLLLPAAGGFAQAPLQLWFRQPAYQPPAFTYEAPVFQKTFHFEPKGWVEALPVGNGRLGAMVFGGVFRERIQLNEETVWAGSRRETVNPAAGAALPEVQRLLFAGENDAAERLAAQTMMGKPLSIQPYQSLGDLLIESAAPAADTAYTRYRRWLSLDSAVAVTQYTWQGKVFRREVFASHPGQVIVVRLTCNQPGSLHVRLRLLRQQSGHMSIAPTGPPYVVMRGRAPAAPQGADSASVPYVLHLQALPSGGTHQTTADGVITVKDADTLTVYIAAATRYNQADPDAYCRQTIQTAAATSVRDLYDRHLKDYQALFNRVSLHLSPGRAPDTLAQDERLARAKTGFEDPYLSELLFQYGRYLLIASSRAGDLPANLQGLWNQQMNPPWSADYHTNINLQMNYMAAEVANLPECHLPLFALMDSLAVSGRRTAQAMYGARGWVVHHLTDIFGRTTPADGVVGIWPMGSGWLARHPFEHYQFSGDKAFLAQRAYPLMKEAARFYLDFLKPIPAGLPMAGRLVTNPSHSPENAFEKADGSQYQFTYGATMDSQICHDLFTNCLAAIEALSTPARNHDPAFKKELEAALQQLVPLQISPRTGTLQEWIEDYREPEIGHRHISHLYGLYPGSQITARTPAWYQAARRTLVRRLTGNPNARTEEAKNRYQSFGSYLGGKSGGGWLSVWVSLLWLRLGEAGEAYQHHQYQLQRGLYPNFFGQAYQLDGTFGSGAVIAEMLLQSHTGTVHLLPALPPKWSAGAFTGLRARGGFTVDLAWQAGKPTTGQIYSRNDATCRLVCDQPIQVLHRGRSVPTKKTGPNEVSFATKAGQLYQIKGR